MSREEPKATPAAAVVLLALLDTHNVWVVAASTAKPTLVEEAPVWALIMPPYADANAPVIVGTSTYMPYPLVTVPSASADRTAPYNATALVTVPPTPHDDIPASARIP